LNSFTAVIPSTVEQAHSSVLCVGALFVYLNDLLQSDPFIS
jgi:hypothetical protein